MALTKSVTAIPPLDQNKVFILMGGKWHQLGKGLKIAIKSV